MSEAAGDTKNASLLKGKVSKTNKAGGHLLQDDDRNSTCSRVVVEGGSDVGPRELPLERQLVSTMPMDFL